MSAGSANFPHHDLVLAAVQGLPLPVDPLPLRVDDQGAVRIGPGRITLDLIVQQYENGMTPEDMVRSYGTLALTDVYAAIAYYLQHKEAVNLYLRRRAEQAATLREELESQRPAVTREALAARRAAQEQP